MEKSKLTDLMSLVSFGMFAVCILLVLLTGAGVYQNLVDRGETCYDQRTALQYVATRIRQADTSGGIALEDFGGQEALVLREEIRGRQYLTRVYCYGGFVRELFTAEGGNFSPDAGEKILAAEELTFILEDSLLTARITLTDGTSQELTLYLRSAEEVVP